MEFSAFSFLRCFSSSEHHPAVNHIVSIFLSRLLFAEKWVEIVDATSNGTLTTRAPLVNSQFELVLPAAHLIPLPREAQV